MMELVYCLLTAIILAVFALFLRYMKQTYSVLEQLNIPGPPPSWLVGNVLAFAGQNPLEVFYRWYKAYGKVYGFYQGLTAGVVINDPVLAKEILVKRFDKFRMRPSFRPFVYFPSTLSVEDLPEDRWRGPRTVLFKALNLRSNMNQMMYKIQNRATVLIHDLEEKSNHCRGGFDISRLVQKFVTTSAIYLTTGMPEEELYKSFDMFDEFQRASKWSVSSDNLAASTAKLFPKLQPILKIFDLEHKRKHDKLVQCLRSFMQLAPSQTEEVNNNLDENNIIDYLKACHVAVKTADGHQLTKTLTADEILGQVMTLISGAFDTTTAAILFMLYELALHPELQDRLYQEITEQCGHAMTDKIDFSTLQRLTYFDKFLCETLRLHPVAPGIARVCTSDCVINGVQFKKGMPVRMMTSTIYQDEHYFHQPGIFDPDRFLSKQHYDRHSAQRMVSILFYKKDANGDSTSRSSA